MRIFVITFLFLSNALIVHAQHHFEKSFKITFPNNKAKQVSYIRFPANSPIIGTLEIEVSGGYNHQLNRGNLTKRINLVFNGGPSGYISQQSEVVSANGELGSQWSIGEFERENTRIPIYHLVSTGNDIVVKVRGTIIHNTVATLITNNLNILGPLDFEGSMPSRSFKSSIEPRIGLGTKTPEHRLDVVGKIRAHEILVNTQKTADHVFEEDYKLRSLDSLAAFIKENGHLPEIPSAEAMKASNLEVGSFQIDLLQKVEELTLYILQLKKEADLRNQKIRELEGKLNGE